MDWDKAAEQLVSNLPSDIIEIMSLLGTRWGPECFLGGGAVRDLLLGKEVKDWDFYFPFTPITEALTISQQLKMILGDKFKFRKYEIGTEHDWITVYSDSYLVLDVTSEMTIPGKKLEFIFSGQKISDFDHAICQCSLNCATFQLETTKWFDRCVEDKIHRIFTCNLNTPYVTNKSIHDHTKRIQKKYPWPIFLETGIKFNYV
jgi:hypothetical protein